MSRRLVSTIFLSVVLLFAQGGSFLIAPHCPHLRANVEPCAAGEQNSVPAHHHMPDVDQEVGKSLVNGDESALDLPPGSCAHCAVHSLTTSTVFSVRDVEAPKRVSEHAVVRVFETPELLLSQAPERLTARSHGPPGNNLARHLLISIFRI